MKIRDIRLNTHQSDFIAFDERSSKCEHKWEPHLWDESEAYCPRCGSFAKRVIATHKEEVP